MSKLVLNTLSGFEGVGKSTIINHHQEKLNYFVIPETARLIMPLEESVLEDSKDDLSYKSFISYLTNIHFLLSNDMKIKCISDRNIIDSLVYLELYSTEQKICIDKLGNFVEEFLLKYEREYFYDNSVLILHPQDDNYIEKFILSDPERRYGENVNKYKHDAKIWEEIYIDIAERLKSRGMFKKLHIVKAYPENIEVIQQIEDITQEKALR